MSQSLSGPLPSVGQNNVWFHYNDSPAAIVFVHGILSDSRSSWLHKDARVPARSVYWPALVRSDSRFGNPSIFLAGFYTAIDAGPYEIRNCAEEVFHALERRDPDGRPGPINKSTIVFVCHSTGGIVARYLLDVNEESFKSKTIGLVLIASPSYGSDLADRLSWIARLYNQRLGQQLEWGSWSLKDLDARFRDLVYQHRLPGLRGVEAYENHFVFHRKWLPNKRLVVTEESAGRYFGAPTLLRKTNHFTSVKPDSKNHPAHELLVDFWQNQIAAAVPPTPAREPDAKPAEPAAPAAAVDDEPAHTATSLWDTAERQAASREPPSLPEVFAGDLDPDITGRVHRTLFGTIYRGIASFLGIVTVGSVALAYGWVRTVRSDRERHLAAVELLGSDLRRDTSLASRLILFDSLQDVVLLDHLEGHAIQRIVQFIQSATPRSSPCQLRTRDDSSLIPRGDVQRALAAVRDLQGRAQRPEGRIDRLVDKFVNRLSPRLTTPTRRLSLETTDLRGSSLRGLDLRGASLRAACLAGTRLDSTQLDRANFDSAQLRSSTLNDATGSNVRFNWADLRDADFSNSTFASAAFVGADLSCATFGNARLDSAEFSGALANWAFFGGATLRAARQWDQIAGLRGAYVADVVDAPAGFLDWARERGASTSNVRQGEWVRAREKQLLRDSLCALDTRQRR